MPGVPQSQLGAGVPPAGDRRWAASGRAGSQRGRTCIHPLDSQVQTQVSLLRSVRKPLKLPCSSGSRQEPSCLVTRLRGTALLHRRGWEGARLILGAEQMHEGRASAPSSSRDPGGVQLLGHLSPQRFASAGPWQSQKCRPRKPPLALAVAACSAGTFLRVGPAGRSWGGLRCRARPSTRMLIAGPASSSSAPFQQDVVLALLLTGPEAAGGEGQRGAGRATARSAGAQRGEAPIPGTCSVTWL